MKKIIIVVYLITLFLFTVFSYLFIDQNLFYLKDFFTGIAFNYREVTTFIYLTLIFLFSIFYYLFLWLINTKKLSMFEAKWLIGITVGILFFSYPAMLSYDIFNYLTTSKVAFYYHENPYVVMPIEFVNEPFLSFTRAANKIALYGPVWIFLTGIPYYLSFGNFIFLLFGFKLFITLFFVLTIILIWKMTKNLFQVALFALNPLVLIETLMSGHNDIVMIFFALFSFYFLHRRNILFAAFFLFLSVFIKYATIFLIPVFLYCLWQMYTKQRVEWEKIYQFSALLMIFVFFLSPVREEIYSWYAIWFLGFISLVSIKKFIYQASIIFSFSLLLRYMPYMLFGTYLAPVPALKNILTFIPLFLFTIYYVLKKKI
ncbi:MAG: hypothetical protein HYV37_02180 [Candidatus Levyibacteriota bacterium]|nr:MAG: hypothetical protein HYV37_02180 [Candidatus Levybacteria bacterium]